MPRLYVSAPLRDHLELTLPPEASRHVQVWRLQPGHGLTVFDGTGQDWPATVRRMGRQDVDVVLGAGQRVDHELPVTVTVAAVMPANDRMDWLVEKATELGAAAIQPLVSRRSVLRLASERAQRKQAHWQAVAVAACEQCGRSRVPLVLSVQPVETWLQASGPATAEGHWLLSLADSNQSLGQRLRSGVHTGGTLTLLSGPEGGWDPEEEALALSLGWAPTTLGPRVLRAETAPLAVLAALGAALD